MGIINAFKDVRMVISDLSENDIRSFLSGREYALVNVGPDVYNSYPNKETIYRYNPFHALDKYFTSYQLRIDDGNEADGGTYLCIKDRFPLPSHSVDGISVTHPSIEELIPMIVGKRLTFRTSFVEDNCNVENVFNEKIQEHFFALWRKDEYYLYDDFFRVHVFLKRVSDGSTADHEYMEPIDVRDLDINEKMLSTLQRECIPYDNEAMRIQYVSESEKLQAQYFLTKFHSNRDWELDPVCILNYRISAFVLPCVVSVEKAATVTEDKIARDLKSGVQYVIDSIHVDSDICFTLTEFDDLIKCFFGNIGLA